MTPQGIAELSYTDFVGFINQWNVLPGSFDTLNRWRIFSGITDTSNVLEIACTTGFSSREVALLTGARCYGIDLSKASIESAKKNKDEFAPHSKLDYEVSNGLDFKSQTPFSHIIIGASLKFFDNPQKMITNINSLLADGGYLLASPFYVTQEIPRKLIEKARTVFGIEITTESFKDIMWMYKDFEILYQERKNLDPETPSELKHYCESTINKFKESNSNFSPEVYEAALQRLLKIKEMSNELRPFQEYVVLVLRSRKKLFGKRLVELF